MDLVDRFRTTFAHEEPDHVPSFVQGIMNGFIDQWMTAYEEEIEWEQVVLTPTKDVTVHCHLGFESSWCGFASPPVMVSEAARAACTAANEALTPAERAQGYRITQQGTLRRTVTLPNGNPHTWMVEGTLDTREKWETFHEGYAVGELPETAVDLYDESMEKALAHDHLLVPTTGLLMEPLIATVGILGIAKLTRKDPAFFRHVCDQIFAVSWKRMEGLCQTRAPIICVPDDCAFKGRPILKPEQYRQFIIPYLKRLVDAAHKAGKKIFLHSDGFIAPYYPYFVEIGLDGHQSLEPVAGMDLAHLKETYAGRFVLIGNVDSSRLLPYGSPEEVARVTRETIQAGAPGGGYVFSPCTDLTDACTLRNVEVMMETYRKNRDYPIARPPA